MTRALRLTIGAVVAAVVTVAVYLVVADSGEPPEVSGVVRGAPPIFGEQGALPLGPSKGVFAPDGSRLAVLDNGQLTVAEDGALRAVTEEGTNVVDVAWFRSSDVMLVAEGPIPTGTVAVVEADGDVRGTIALDPSVTFGPGFGMTVLPGNRKAVVTAVERRELDAVEYRYLVEIDLETGRTRAIADADGTRPYVVGEDGILFTGVHEDVGLLDLSDGTRQDVAEGARSVGVIRDRWVAYQKGDRVLARPVDTTGALGREQVVLDLPAGTDAVAVDPTGAAVLVLATELTAEGDAVPRLRRVAIREADRFRR